MMSYCNIKLFLHSLLYLAVFSLDDFSAYSHVSNFSLMAYTFLFRVLLPIFADRTNYDVTNSIKSRHQVDIRVVLGSFGDLASSGDPACIRTKLAQTPGLY